MQKHINAVYSGLEPAALMEIKIDWFHAWDACYEEMKKEAEFLRAANLVIFAKMTDRETKLVAALNKIEQTKCCPSCMLNNIQSSLIAREAIKEIKSE